MSGFGKQEKTKELKANQVGDREKKLQEVFHQIDLVQARINKEQEEIQHLSQETDEVLHQLGLKAS